MSDATEQPVQQVICPAAKDPTVRLFILAAMLLGFGIWCILDLPKYPKPTSNDVNKWGLYFFNHGGAYCLTPLGIIPLVWGFVCLKRKLVADADGVGLAGKTKIAWSKVEKLDASKLADKGILYLYHDGGRKFTLDSWKLQNFKALVAFVETHVPAEAGSGGRKP